MYIDSCWSDCLPKGGRLSTTSKVPLSSCFLLSHCFLVIPYFISSGVAFTSIYKPTCLNVTPTGILSIVSLSKVTSINTEVGKIAKSVMITKKEKSPLTIRVEKFTKDISFIIVIISIIIHGTQINGITM